MLGIYTEEELEGVEEIDVDLAMLEYVEELLSLENEEEELEQCL